MGLLPEADHGDVPPRGLRPADQAEGCRCRAGGGIADPRRDCVGSQCQREQGDGRDQRRDTSGGSEDAAPTGLALEGEGGQGDHRDGELGEVVPDTGDQQGQGHDGTPEAPGVDHRVVQADGEVAAAWHRVGHRRGRLGADRRLRQPQTGEDGDPHQPIGGEVPEGRRGQAEDLDPRHGADLLPDGPEVGDLGQDEEEDGDDQEGREGRLQEAAPCARGAASGFRLVRLDGSDSPRCRHRRAASRSPQRRGG